MTKPRVHRFADLGRLLAKRWLEHSPAVSTESLPVIDAPLSETQAGLWIFEQLYPATAVNNLACRALLRGPVNVALLVTALKMMAERHQLDRVVAAGDVPTLVTSPLTDHQVHVVDLRSAGEDAAGIASAEATVAAAEPFNLTDGPLARASIYWLDDRTVMLLLVGHHLVVDGQSLIIILEDLGGIYAALDAGATPAPLPPTAPQRADPAREEADRAHWRRTLAGMRPLALPTDRPPPARRTFRTGFCPISFNGALTDAIRSLAVTEHTTAFTVITAAFQTLLARLCGQKDIVVGIPVTIGDPLERVVGAHVNMAAIRSAVEDGMPFRAFVADVRHSCVEALGHRTVPAESVARELTGRVERLGYSRFNTMLTLQKRPATTRFGPVTVDLLEAKPVAIQRDLAIHLWEGATTEGWLGYDAELFDAATAVRLVEQFTTLLHAAVTDPDQRIADLPLLTAEQRQRITTYSTGPYLPIPATTIVDLIRTQAHTSPGDTAVHYPDGTLTYAELEHRASAIANHLAAHRIGEGNVVAVCLPRTPDLVSTLVGVLKTGAAYLPLDPTHPAERITHLLANSNADHLITHPDTTPASTHPITTTDITRPLEPGIRTTAPAPHNLAYLIYTSGSTGTPKAVAVTHHNLLNVLLSLSHTLGLGPDHTHTVAALTTVSFDIAALEIYLPLMHGGTITLIDHGLARHPDALATHLDNTHATLVQATPTTWKLLLGTGWQPQAPLTALSGGEAIPPDLATALNTITRHACNLYGPTETAIYSTQYTITSDAAAPVPIGRPIHNTQIHILDSRLRLAPVGVPGEIFIGGDGVARGYLNAPALTAKQFLPDPFRHRPGARMYRTGDLARWLPDGNLEFLGRTDHQLKIRGHRIEPGEIESTLRRHSQVRDAAVIGHHRPDGPELHAYITGDADPTTVREHLQRHLPDYMLPATITTLDALPLTPNGKLDRKALPTPNPTRTTTYTAPRNTLEHIIAAIWQGVLDSAEPIGIHDDFFHLGGHSLLAIRVLARLRTTLNNHIPAGMLFENPTIAQLAPQLRAQPRNYRIPLTAQPRSRDATPMYLPASFGQHRIWFLSTFDQQAHLAYHMLGGAHITGALDVTALQRAITTVTTRHEALRTTFSYDEDTGLHQVIHPPTPFALSRYTLTSPDYLHQLIETETNTPFDLETGPLIRCALATTDNTHHTLIYGLHHTICDGWSLAVLLREIATAYHTHTTHTPLQLAPLPVQYADYAHWHHQFLATDDYTRQLDYWRAQLTGITPLNLPTDRPRPNTQSFTGAQTPIVISAETVTRLGNIARREGATIHMALLAALGALLHRHTNNTDITIGTPTAGRIHPDLEDLIGFFVNTLVIRVQYPHSVTFRQLLRQARDTCIDAQDNQDIPFEKLVEELNPRRDLSSTPLFQVMLTFNSQPPPALSLPGVELKPLHVSSNMTPFPLNLAIGEGPNGTLCGELVYNTDLFEAGTAKRLVERFTTLLDAAITNPDTPLCSTQETLPVSS